jgi:hypothetical protein
LNLIHRDYAGLTEALEYDQGAPLGFLFLSRAAVVAFGDSEYVLRLVPFLASVVAPFVFLLVARRLLSGLPLGVAVVLFAVSEPLTRYAAECKPYAVDVLAALVLTLLMLRYAERSSLGRGLALAVTGLVSIAFSFTAIFVLAGGGLALLLGGLGGRLRGDWRLFVMGGVWVLAFGLYYWFAVRRLTTNEEVVAWHSDAYMPLPPRSADDVYWFLQAAVDAFSFPVGLALPGIGLVFAVLGMGLLLDRSRVALPLVLLPAFFALVASGLHQYPFTQRFILFLAPALMILIGAGFGVLRHNGLVGVVLLLMLIHPVLETAYRFVKPDSVDGIRPVVAHLAVHRQPDDPIYVYHWAHPGFRYYAPKYGISADNVVTDLSSRRDWGHYIGSIEPFAGDARVWFVFEHAGENLSAGEEQFFLTYLDRIGTRLDSVSSRTASGYLYDLSEFEP